MWWWENQGCGFSYRSEDHVEWHGDVEVEGVVVDHTDREEHGHHDHIVSGQQEKKDTAGLFQSLHNIFPAAVNSVLQSSSKFVFCVLVTS